MKTNYFLLAISLLSQLSFALGAEAPVADVYHVKTMSKDTATEWCGGHLPLSGVEELPQEVKLRHKLPPSGHLYSKIYTGCVCPQGQIMYKFGQKEKYCPTPKTQDEICLLVVDPLAPRATDLAADMLKITSAFKPQVKPLESNPVKSVEGLEKVNSSIELKTVVSKISPEMKKKIIDELPKMDFSMCEWGCANTETSHALVFNMATIIQAAKNLQGSNSKVLKIKILTNNQGAAGSKIEILRQMEYLYSAYLTKNTFPLNIRPNESIDGYAKDYEWFLKNIVPNMTVEYVPDLVTDEKSPHFDYKYDFD